MHFTFLPVYLEIGIIDENIPKNIFEAQMEIFYAKKVTFWVIWSQMKITLPVTWSNNLEWKINPTIIQGNFDQLKSVFFITWYKVSDTGWPQKCPLYEILKKNRPDLNLKLKKSQNNQVWQPVMNSISFFTWYKIENYAISMELNLNNVLSLILIIF